MSRIGNKPIIIPENVTVAIENSQLKVKGEKGELTLKIPNCINISQKENVLTIKRQNNLSTTKAIHGLIRSLVNNNVIGVSQGFKKTLKVVGVGYRVALENQVLTLQIGFSHPIQINVPENLEVTVEKNNIIVSGIDKQLVGNFCAKIRAVKPPEPYKGKGIRYSDEIVKLKPGKTVKAVGK